MLKKDNFVWTNEAKLAFQHPKQLLSSTLVLALSDFDKTFVVETDIFEFGVGG